MSFERQLGNHRPNLTYSMGKRRRARVKQLDSSCPEHFHHLAELARSRKAVLNAFKQELVEKGWGDLSEVSLHRKAGTTPDLDRLIKEKDLHIMDAIIHVACLPDSSRGKIITEFLRIYKEANVAEIEVSTFFNFFTGLVNALRIPKQHKEAFRRGFADWIEARLLSKIFLNITFSLALNELLFLKQLQLLPLLLHSLLDEDE